MTPSQCVLVCTGFVLALSVIARGQDAPPPPPAPPLPPTEPVPAGESAPVAEQSPALETEHEPAPAHEKGWGELIRFTFFWENDGTVPKPGSSSDDHYTSALKLDFAWKPDWAQDWLTWVPFSDQFGPNPQTAFGLSVQQLIFTPEDLEATEVQEKDGPYAGWLSFAAYWQRSGQLTEHIATFDHIELDAGVVGEWSGAQWLQEWVHHTWPDEVDPEGWSNQVPNTLAVDITIRKKWRFSTDTNADGVSLQFIPSIGGTVGTVYRQLEADATVRMGWNLPDDFGPTRIADVNAATGGWSSDFGFYIFGRLGGNLVQHNIFLDGSDFTNNPHTVDSEPFVGELQVGAVLLVWKHLEIGYAQTFLSEEFEGQDEPDAYGAISIGYRASF